MEKNRHSSLIRRLIGLSSATVPDVSEKKPLAYEDAKQLAEHADPTIRIHLASRTDLFPEILGHLSGDPDPRVRCEIAGNVATLERANLILAQDKNDDVRIALAKKITDLVPGLSFEEHQRLNTATLEALNILSRDQVVRIRRMIADALKEISNAPAEMIRRLAQDEDFQVAAPILEFSPVLTDEDLLMIIHSGPITGAMQAISRRAPVQERVSDALVASHDVDVITTLLKNQHALIREQTLDFLLDRAAQIPAWHAPLVRRPHLPPAAMMRLATFVATDLLDSLRGRADLTPEALRAVSAIVHKRLNTYAKHEAEPKKNTTSIEVAEAMHKAGALTEAAVLAAISAGNHDFARSALAVRSGLLLSTVSAILASKNALAVVSLTWKSGLSAACVVSVQRKLADIPASDLMIMEKGGVFSLSAHEMMAALKEFGV